MYIDVDTIIKISAALAALGGIGGVVVWCIKFVDRQKRQPAKDLSRIKIRKELDRSGRKSAWEPKPT